MLCLITSGIHTYVVYVLYFQPQSLHIFTLLGKTDYMGSWNEEVVACMRAVCRNSRRKSAGNLGKCLGLSGWLVTVEGTLYCPSQKLCTGSRKYLKNREARGSWAALFKYRIIQYVLNCLIVPLVVALFLWSSELSFLLTPMCGLSPSAHASGHFMNHSSFIISTSLIALQ